MNDINQPAGAAQDPVAAGAFARFKQIERAGHADLEDVKPDGGHEVTRGGLEPAIVRDAVASHSA